MTIARIRVRSVENLAVATIAGEVDIANSKVVRSQLLSGIGNREHGLIVDLTETRLLDSAGINVLFELLERLSQRRQTLGLVLPDRGSLRRTLEIVGLLGAVPAHASLAEALEAAS
jgi:anti-anti-sigma factor